MIRDLLARLRIIPVLTVASTDQALATCKALAAGGIRGVEITLRSDAALDAITHVRESMPDFCVGAGTIKTAGDLDRVAERGVAFAVSPGLSDEVLAQALAKSVPLMPGIATATELMRGLDAGLDCFKLFPAEAVGGRALLKSLAAPFPEAAFCPTGGVSPDNFLDYLALPNVLCVGGSWMVADSLLAAADWDEVTARSAQAMAAARGNS